MQVGDVLFNHRIMVPVVGLRTMQNIGRTQTTVSIVNKENVYKKATKRSRIREKIYVWNEAVEVKFSYAISLDRHQYWSLLHGFHCVDLQMWLHSRHFPRSSHTHRPTEWPTNRPVLRNAIKQPTTTAQLSSSTQK